MITLNLKKLLLLLLILFTPIFIFSQQALHLYGGQDYTIYLGCINCSSYDNNSIWNEYGDYGSSYSDVSIWNSYSEYGSEYDDYSPWNSYSSTPPKLYDNDGGFYGYFTINEYQPDWADFKLALFLYKNHNEIRDNVSKWYSLIFEN